MSKTVCNDSSASADVATTTRLGIGILMRTCLNRECRDVHVAAGLQE
jgi:hypothetical protein